MKKSKSSLLAPILQKSPTEMYVDISLLDIMGIDEFLSVLKYRTENNQKDTWKEIAAIVSQLKASRELMFVESHLYSSKLIKSDDPAMMIKLIDRLVESTRVIFDVERLNIYEIEVDTDELVLTHSTDKQIVGIRYLSKDGLESKHFIYSFNYFVIFNIILHVIADEVISKRRILNITAATVEPNLLKSMDIQGKKSMKNLLCAPIFVEKTVVGVMVAVNKTISGINTPRDIGASKESAFSSNEESCFSFIASIVGASLLRQCKSSAVTNKLPSSSASVSSTTSSISFNGSIGRNKRSIFNLHNRVSDVSSKRTNPVENVGLLQGLLDLTYIKLEAERVSIFAYDSNMKQLVCAVSLDVKGISVPIDVGYVGQCFSSGKIINSYDVEQDPLHYREVDLKSGFVSHSVLSVPILDGDCRTIGVVQAMNKKSKSKFTVEDEGLLGELGSKYFHNLLNSNNTVPEESDDSSRASIINGINTVAIASSAAATISRYIVDLIKCKSIDELLARSEHSVKSFIQPPECDSLAIYFAEKDYLARAAIRDKLNTKHLYFIVKESFKISELKSDVKDALLAETVTELYSTQPNEPMVIFPDLSGHQAFFVPMKVNINSVTPFSCVMVYTKSNATNSSPFSPTTKDLLTAFSRCFCCSLEELLERSAIEDNLRAMQSNLSKISNTLHNLQEVIIVLNSEGHVVMCNKSLSDFFGFGDSEFKSSFGFHPISDMTHYSYWLSEDACPQLFQDIGTSLQSGRLISREDILIAASGNRSEDFYVDYRIVVIENNSDTTVSAVLITIRKSNYDVVKVEQTQTPTVPTTRNLDTVLVNPSIPLPADLFEWEFNALDVTDKAVLCNAVGKFFENLLGSSDFGLNYSLLANYISEVSVHYHDRPFHNFQHSATVSHFTYMLLNATNAIANLKPHMIFAILLSAVVHDVDHPGNTNTFEINSRSELALLYNDQAVLENHHCSLAFRLMRKDNMQILSTIAKPIESEIRKFVISCVLATDMSVHFDLIEEIKRKPLGWSYEDVKDQLTLGKVLVHAADLSNPVRPFQTTVAWARRVSTEFNNQVLMEESLNLPVLPFMVYKDENDFCRNEIGFSSFVVAPMWKALKVPFPEVGFLVEQMERNLVDWKQWAERIKEEDEGNEKK